MKPDDNRKRVIAGILAVAVVVAAIIWLSAMAADTDGAGSTNTTQGPGAGTGDLFPARAYPEYAKGFSVDYHRTYKVIRIHDPWGREEENFTYLLVQRGEEVPDGYPDAQVFSVPVERAITLAVVHLSQIGQLRETASIVGHNGIDLAYDEEIRRLAAAGAIEEIGSGANSMATTLKMERIIELEPEVVFCVANGNREYDNHYKMQEAGLKPVVVAEWMENHPLARAEWIKFFACFYNREQEANDYFDRIEADYLALAAEASRLDDRPAVFSGVDYQGTWYAPGGESYVAVLFRDAGADYILANDTARGSVPLDAEVMFAKAHDADYWLNTGAADTTDELLALEPRYANFGAFRSGHIYTYNARVNAAGGNDYWQSGIIHPEIVLADLVKILHPDLVPNHELYYYIHVGPGQGEAA